MAHSHLPVQHLIRQVETRRSQKKRNEVRPEWVTRFIDRMADLFEPLDGVARVGFLCRPDDGAWTVTMYLGRTEIVGGRDDGTSHSTSFHLDIQGTLACFSEVQSVRWTACPDAPAEETEASSSLLRVEGLVEGTLLRLVVTSVPPDVAGPGLRKYPDGRCSPA
ncbi:MAG: hypothetical protein IT428_00625 [Planctomycetaceae bacterium]|nr:hypothetical protein [Planctomycetaceae bacterium]